MLFIQKINNNKGMTIIEVMIVLLISSIILGYAVPAFTEIIRGNSSANFANNFIGDVQLARLEAIKRSTPVSVCPASDNNLDACGSNSDWRTGWLIFVDSDGDGALAASTDLIKVHEITEDNMSISTVNAVITFSEEGFASAGSGTFTIQATGCTGEHAKSVTLTAVGRTSVDATTCS